MSPSIIYNLSLCSFVLQEPDPNAKFNGYIPLDKMEISYSCSSGPGGQNVNRVNTKVDLRFQLNNANWLSEEIRTKLAEQVNNVIYSLSYN